MTSREKRCEDCASVGKQNGCMWCKEVDKACDKVEDCPFGIELEEVQEIRKKGESLKIKHGAGMADKSGKTEKNSRKVKISDEKSQIFADILGFLGEKYEVEVLTENKLVEITLKNKKFKLNLSENRQKKA